MSDGFLSGGLTCLGGGAQTVGGWHCGGDVPVPVPLNKPPKVRIVDPDGCGDATDCAPRSLPCDSDVEKLKCLNKEYYLRHGARLQMKVLDKEESCPHPFYNDTRTVDRVYLPDQTVYLFGPFDPHSYDQIFWGIDVRRALIFFASTPLMQDAGIDPKAGDLIVYHGVEHEILTVKRKEDSYFDQKDYSFEWAIATHIPNRGS